MISGGPGHCQQGAPPSSPWRDTGASGELSPSGDERRHRLEYRVYGRGGGAVKQEGYPLDEADLAHIWPTRYAHLNVYGKYRFNVEEIR